MFVVSLLYLYWTNNEANVMLLPGYYNVFLIGATGGTIGTNILGGGQGANFTGVLKIVGDTHLRIVAGSSPSYDNPQKPGPFGEGGWGGVNASAGGGYSAIFKNNEPIVMVGGGGGSLSALYGRPAGGYKSGQSYFLHGEEKVFQNGTSTNYHGYNGTKVNPPGSGGGGGYFGGPVLESKGLGGSSYFIDSYFSNSTLLDGMQAREINIYRSHGIVTISNISICHKNCISCEYHDNETCNICRPGKRLINMRCLDSCDEINSSTYTDSDNSCKPCMENCEKCTNATFCTKCKSGYHFDGTKCTNETSPQLSPSQSDEDVNISIDQKSYFKGAKIETNPEQQQDKPFPYWIIGIICGAVLIVVVLIVVICKKKKEASSVEMAEENPDGAKNSTTVTVDNPLYSHSTNQEEDPFHNDFEEDYEVSQVFKSHYPDDKIDDDE